MNDTTVWCQNASVTEPQREVGPKMIAGAIAPSAYKSEKLSRVCTASTLLPSAEQKKRECYESDSRRGYANKNAIKVLKGFGKTFSKVFPRKNTQKTPKKNTKLDNFAYV